MSGYASIEIRIDTGGADGIPHTFIYVTHPDGSTTEYGFAPQDSGSPIGPGAVYITGAGGVEGHEFDASTYAVDITSEQYTGLMDYISQTTTSPPDYLVDSGMFTVIPGYSRNCTTWARDAFWQSGISMPEGMSVADTPYGQWLHDYAYDLFNSPDTGSDSPVTWGDLYDLLPPYYQDIIDGIVDYYNEKKSWLDGKLEDISDFIDSLKDLFNSAESLASPLILDLDGDGVETTAMSDVNFDHDGNGFAETTGWVGKDDGLLVLDRNGNGVIDNGSELFGDGTLLSDGSLAANGFAALADFDSNQDGVLDANDAAYANLRIWKDANENGITDAGELIGLSDAGVVSMSTAYIETNTTDSSGNQHLQSGTYTRSDGSVGDLHDVWFRVDYANTEDVGVNDGDGIGDDVKALPQVIGFGNVHSLHDAMELDESGTLENLVEQFIQAGDSAQRSSIVNQILIFWAGADQYAEDSRGSNLQDGRILYVLEAFLGENYNQGSWGATPGPQAAAVVRDAYRELSGYVYGQLMLQSHFSSLLDQIKVTYEGGAVVWDVSSVVSTLRLQYETDEGAAIATLQEFGAALKSMYSTRGDELLLAMRGEGDMSGSDFDVALAVIDKMAMRGDSAGNTLNGRPNLDVALLGFSGNDNLRGSSGDDFIVGGSGNDYLTGGVGSDIYLYELGDGQDTINNYDVSAGRFDVLKFGKNIAADSVTATRTGSDLVLSIDGTSDRIVVSNYFAADGTGGSQLDEIRFSDGTVWDVETLKPMVQIPTDGDDSLYGYESSDVLAGLVGNDVIYGYGGDDVLQGGVGSDRLSGGAGSDTYHFEAGDGRDIIDNYDGSSGRVDVLQFGAGIEPDGVTARRQGNSLILTFSSGTDQVTVTNYFSGDGAGGYQLDEIRFADGTVWDVATIKPMVQIPTGSADELHGYATSDTLSGLAGNDVIQGHAGDDVIEGGLGDDTLSGDAGSDTYIFNVGDGQDVINNYDTGSGRVDVLQFTAGVEPGDVTARRQDDSLILSFSNGADRITVSNYFAGDGVGGHEVDEIRFASGEVWDVTSIKSLVQIPTGDEDEIHGYATNDTLGGLAGNDVIQGHAGDDVLEGGTDNDTLVGGSGSDTYLFNVGDGQDVINNYDTSTGRVDSLRFAAGIEPGDITARRQDNSLILVHANGTDKITVANYFTADAAGGYQLDEVRFANGAVWSVETVKSLVLVPTEGEDNLRGYATDDTIAGAGSNDALYGEGGNDVLNGEDGNDALYGGSGEDLLGGGTGADSLRGDSGDDTLQGGLGDDVLNGGSGSDTYAFSSGDGQDTINNYDSTSGRFDVLSFGAGIAPSDVTARRVNNDLVLTFAGNEDKVTVSNYFVGDASGNYQLDQIRFSDQDQTIWDVETVKALVLVPTAGEDTLRGYATSDTLAGGDGDDLLYGNGGNDILDGEVGSDTIYGGEGNDAVAGGADVDTLYGEAGDDTLDGGAGNDTLRGGLDGDHLTGGQGDDQLEGGSGDDHYHFAVGDGRDVINDTQGLSTIHLLGLSLDDAYLRRDGTALVIRFLGSSGDEIRLLDVFSADTQLAVRGLVIDSGGGTPWELNAAAIDAAALVGTEVGDTIDGNTLDNAIEGLAGNDVLRGGSGADGLNGGADNDSLYGQEGNDTLAGGEGNDLLDGGSGADQLLGGAGDDIYVIDNVGDTASEVDGGGQDTVQSNVSFVLPDDFEKVLLTGSNDIDGTGNDLANNLVGNSGNNHLQGLAGDDVLVGGSGDDILDGGIGDDQVGGGEGSDSLFGGAGQDVLDGGYGVDTLTGGSGDDNYTIDDSMDVVVEQAGEGTDVIYAHSDYTLSANVEKLILVEGSGAYQGTGSAGDEIIVGNSSSNRLDGAAGADQLSGGDGNDTYVVDNVGDQVLEIAGEGNDTVESSIDYTLGSTLENLTLLGSSNLNGTGNDQGNILIGNTGNNRLEGGLSGDSLYGGSGDDLYIEESDADWVYESVGEGLDTVERRFETNLILKDNVENLVLATGIQTGNGNDLANLITGNTGDNRLAGLDGDDELLGLEGNDSMWGGGGSDRLIGADGNDYLDGSEGIDHLEGGAGNDVYITDDAGDVVVEAASGGTDQVQTTASYTLSANIENLFLTGDQAINGTGNALGNYLAGNSADNTLSGMDGNDTLVGDAGSDSLIGGAGDDDYVVAVGSGTDVIDNIGGGFDGIFFEGTVTREQLSFSRDGDDLLISIDNSTTPAVRVTNHFLGGDAAIDFVQPGPAGSYYLTTAEINQIVAAGGSGGEYDQVIEGTAAGEQLVGSTGKDLVKGLAGDDTLFGMSGNDTLQGGDGADYLAGGNGSGTGSGDDRLEGDAGNDTLRGEEGVNALVGGANDDSYVYGGGQDTIDNTGGGYDGVFFENGITAAQLAFTRDGDDLVITVDGDANATVRVTGHFLGGDAAIDFVQPATGSPLDTAAINALADDGGTPPGGDDDDYPSVVTGTAAGEQLLGTNGRDLIKGLGGNDQLFGFSGDDKLEGGDGNDYLSGGNGMASNTGNDILIGGAGVDQLVGEDGDDQMFGGLGDDKYVYGGGADTIDNTGGGTDWLLFNSSAYSVESSRITFHRDGDDLIVRVDGDTSKQVRVIKHFLGGDYALAYVQPLDGYAIPASDFNDLLVSQSESSFGLSENVVPSLTGVRHDSGPTMSTGGRGSQSLRTEPPLSLGLPPDRDAPIMSGGLDPDVHAHRPDVATGGELDASLLPGQSDDARAGLIPWRNLRDVIEWHDTWRFGSRYDRRVHERFDRADFFDGSTRRSPAMSEGLRPDQVADPSLPEMVTGGALHGVRLDLPGDEGVPPHMGGAMVPQLRDPTIPPMVNLESESIGGVEASSELQSLISAMAGFSPDAGGMDVFYMESELIQPQVAVVSPL